MSQTYINLLENIQGITATEELISAQEAILHRLKEILGRSESPTIPEDVKKEWVKVSLEKSTRLLNNPEKGLSLDELKRKF